MAYQIILKKRFTNKVQKVLYLEKEWSQRVAAEFTKKIDYRIEILGKQPFMGIPSTKIKDIRGLLVSRHKKLYYKIKDDKVIIMNMYDTRMNPKRNPY